MKLITSVLVFTAAIYAVYALCNTCSAVTNLACVSNNQFQFCVNGLPAGQVIQCPSGSLCTGMAEFCSPAETAPPSCGRCGICSTLNSFACIGYKSYAFCLGSVVLNTVNFTCAGTLICNIDVAELCVDPALTGIGGTCPSVGSNTTTQNPGDPLTDVNAFCRNKASTGRYEDTTDPTCKGYVYCTRANDTWVGSLYECPGRTFFNATSRLCGVGTPARCA